MEMHTPENCGTAHHEAEGPKSRGKLAGFLLKQLIPTAQRHTSCSWLTCGLIHHSYAYWERKSQNYAPSEAGYRPYSHERSPVPTLISNGETRTARKDFEVTQQAPGSGRRRVSEPRALHSRHGYSQLLAPGPSAPGHVPHQRQEDRGLLTPQPGLTKCSPFAWTKLTIQINIIHYYFQKINIPGCELWVLDINLTGVVKESWRDSHTTEVQKQNLSTATLHPPQNTALI